MPSAMLQTRRTIRNTCVNDKTDEVIILLLEIELVSSSVFFRHTFIHIATTKMISIAY